MSVAKKERGQHGVIPRARQRANEAECQEHIIKVSEVQGLHKRACQSESDF